MKIKCHLCGKPVDEVRTWQDHDNRCFVIEVKCHGATDRMRLPHLLMVLDRDVMRQIEDQDGVAFQTPTLEAKRA